MAKGREQFLKIYKEDGNSKGATDLDEDEGKPKEIKFRKDNEGLEDEDLEERRGELLRLNANESGH